MPVVEKITPQIEAMASGTTSVTAVGGMITKVRAAQIATKAGCGVFIASGEHPSLISALFAGNARGTFFVPNKIPMHSRKRWIAYFTQPSGAVRIDAGAEKALRKGSASLLAKGIVQVRGDFAQCDVISIENQKGEPIARGISEFSSEEASRIVGKSSEEIKKLLPRHRHAEVVHHDAMTLL